jgi:hypothetical protein
MAGSLNEFSPEEEAMPRITALTSRRFAILGLCLALVATGLPALDANDFSSLVGYTIVAVTAVDGDFEGAEYGKLVQLQNGMAFRFDEYNYSYAYQPDVVVFAKQVTAGPRSVVLYKLLIDDEMYAAHRVRISP